MARPFPKLREVSSPSPSCLCRVSDTQETLRCTKLGRGWNWLADLQVAGTLRWNGRSLGGLPTVVLLPAFGVVGLGLGLG